MLCKYFLPYLIVAQLVTIYNLSEYNQSFGPVNLPPYATYQWNPEGFRNPLPGSPYVLLGTTDQFRAFVHIQGPEVKTDKLIPVELLGCGPTTPTTTTTLAGATTTTTTAATTTTLAGTYRPVLRLVVPDVIQVGHTPETFVAWGSNFHGKSRILVDGFPQATLYASYGNGAGNDWIEFFVEPHLFQTVGLKEVVVENPPGDAYSGVSNKMWIMVQ